NPGWLPSGEREDSRECQGKEGIYEADRLSLWAQGLCRSVQNHETACSAATTSRLQVSVRRSHSAVVPPRCVPAGRVGTEPSWRLKQGDHFPALLYTAPNNCHAASHR